MSQKHHEKSQEKAADRTMYSGKSYDFYVVGIGASAGGLEALEHFFHELPTDAGMAYVVVQHLSPDFESQMDQLLARQSELPIHRVTDGMVVEPNNIYLIPPKKEMTIAARRLMLTDKDPHRGLALPIDHFFSSLAEECRGHAVGIILSGTGSDGSRGVVDIRNQGGLVLCQSEESARFNGMPLSAQQTGAVDLILPPEQMPAMLVRYTRESVSKEQLATELPIDVSKPNPEAQGIERLFQCLQRDYGIDFTHYRSNTVSRRIQRRMLLTNAANIDDYANATCDNIKEMDILYRDLLIGVTQFFRDREPFEYLETEIIPEMIRKAGKEQIRIWCAGCATGEEPYSLAMLFHRELARQDSAATVKIFATDLHQNSLDFASLGVYQEAQVNSLDPELRDRYFEKTSQGWSVSQELRQMIVFARHNLIADSPFTRVDMVTCRNLLIYFQPALQKKVLSLFHFALKAGGILMLGNSETLGALQDEFELQTESGKIYKKIRNIRIPIDTRLLSDFTMNSPRSQLRSNTGVVLPGATKAPISDSQLLSVYDKILLRIMPPGILVNHEFEVLHTFGGAEEFLKFIAGRPSNKILDIIAPDFRGMLTSALHHAQKEQKAVSYSDIEFTRGSAKEKFNIIIEPVKTHLLTQAALLIKFERATRTSQNDSTPLLELTDADAASNRIAQLEEQLEHSQENLQATVEELETSNEELQAANEELVASNEELQSTNEELHSVNEELYSVNVEHQKRIHDLTVMTDDLENLLRSTEFGVMFLDRQLKIRKFTRDIAQHFNLIPSDVGRRINHFTHSLKHVNLVEDLEQVLSTGDRIEREVANFENSPFLLRILPYRVKTGVDGVVVTLIDIQQLKESEAVSRRLTKIVEFSHDAIFSLDFDGTIRTWNKGAENLYGYTAEEIVGQNMRLTVPQHFLEEFDDICRKIARGQSIDDYVTTRIRKDGQLRKLWIKKAPIVNDDGEPVGISAIDRDVTEQQEAEIKLRLQERAINAATNGVVIADARQPDFPITYVNKGFERITGYAHDMVVGLNCRFLQGQNTELTAVNKIRQSLKNKEGCEVLILNYRKDGTPFWNNLKLSPVKDDSGVVTHFVGIQTDVTEQVHIDEELKQAKRDADTANRAKSAFLAHMSHEIRTPITTIIGLSEVLTRKIEDPETLKILEMMRYSGNHLVNLINDILDLSRVEAGKLTLEKRPCDLPRLLQDLFQLMKYRAEEKKIDFEFKSSGEIPSIIMTDPTRLRQILINLLGNGIKFTDNGFVHLKIESRRYDHHADLVFSISDTGSGIESRQIPHLFKPFSQFGSDEQRFQGTGLGLAITKRLADALDGTLEVQSTPRKGSTFTLRLPTELLDQTRFVTLQTSGDDEQPENTQAPDYNFSARKILIAEDTKSIQFLLTSFLRDTNITIDTADDGEAALNTALTAIEAGQPHDIILLDMQMPKMDGYQVVGRLRDRKINTPVIALTANAMAGDKEICLAAGCDEYLTKPVSRPRLLEKLHFLFSQSRR